MMMKKKILCTRAGLGIFDGGHVRISVRISSKLVVFLSLCLALKSKPYFIDNFWNTSTHEDNDV